MEKFKKCSASIVAIGVILLSCRALALREKEKQVLLDRLEDYTLCQTKFSPDDCLDAIRRWVETNPEDSFRAGKLVRLNTNGWAAIPYFASAFDAKKGDCKDGDVRIAVLRALDLPADLNPKILAQAKKIGFETCWTEMKAPIVEAAAPTSYTFKNVCKELVAKGAITGLKAKKCGDEK